MQLCFQDDLAALGMSGALLRPWALWQLNTLPSWSHSLSECDSWRADVHFPGWHWAKSLKTLTFFRKHHPLTQLRYSYYINRLTSGLIPLWCCNISFIQALEFKVYAKCIFDTPEKGICRTHLLLCGWCYTPNTSGLAQSRASAELSAHCMLTCKINKPWTYLITRETTSSVHLKAGRVRFYAPVC